MNKVFAIGRLVADPTLNQKDGVSILNFRLAADTRKKDAQGNNIACFYRVALWRRHAEVMAGLLHKGDRISVSGDFVPSTYTDTNGVPPGKHGYRKRRCGASHHQDGAGGFRRKGGRIFQSRLPAHACGRRRSAVLIKAKCGKGKM